MLFGATGHTGRLIAERLVAAGVRPVLAGRDARRLSELAGRLGGLEHATADARRPETLRALLAGSDVLVSTVGPFARHGAAAVRAAIAAGAHYLDSTGEPAFIRSVFEQHEAAARSAGATLLPAMGYDFVPGSLAGALALERSGAEAVRVDVAYFALGRGSAARLSRGTRVSAVGAALDGSFAFRSGAIQTVRFGERARPFTVAGTPRPALSVGGAEHFALPAAYPRLREVNVYLGWFGAATGGLRAASLALAGPLRIPGVRTGLRLAGERLAGRAAQPAAGPAAGESLIFATAYDAGDRPLAEVRLSGAEPYAFTAGMLAWAASRAARDGIGAAGALGPLEAFGLAELQRGCAEAGLGEV